MTTRTKRQTIGILNICQNNIQILISITSGTLSKEIRLLYKRKHYWCDVMKKGDDSKHNIYNVNGSFQISCTHIHLEKLWWHKHFDGEMYKYRVNWTNNAFGLKSK